MANSKIQNLTAITTPLSTDVAVIVNDPSGTPTDRSVTLANLSKGLNAGNIPITPVGGIAATNLQAALSELDTEKLSTSGTAATVTTNANMTGDITSVGNATTYNNTVPSLKGGFQVATSVGGTVDAITAVYSPVLTLADRTVAVFRSTGENTSTTPTFAPDGLTPKVITHFGGIPLHPNDTGIAGHVCIVMYSGVTDKWELIDPIYTLDGLSDVVISSPVSGDLLGYNGANFVNVAASIASAGAGVTFYNSSPTITATGLNNVVPILSLVNTPVTTAEQTVAGTVNNTTSPIAAWLDGVLGRTSIDAGLWSFNTYYSIDSATGATSLTRNVYSVLPQDGGAVTVTVTGTGTSRTFTASGGTPFATTKIDASATNTVASYISTPLGIYQITARTSDTVVTVTVPTTYTNESTVAFQVWKKLFGVNTGELNATSVALASFQTTQPAFTITVNHKLGLLSFITTTNSRIFTIYYDGTEHNTSFQSPLTVLHNNLPGLNGGTSNQYYHLTSTEYTGTGTGDFVRKISPALTTPSLDNATALSLNKFIATIGGTPSTGMIGQQIDTGNPFQSEYFALRADNATAAVGSVFVGARSRGTLAAPTVIQSGDSLFGILALGYDGTDYAQAGSLFFEVDGTPGDNDMPARMVIKLSPDGTQVPVEAFRISQDKSALFAGNVGLGANSLTLTGSIAATGARVTKGWFTDLESTNMPTVGGTAILSSLTAPSFTSASLGTASTTAGQVVFKNATNAFTQTFTGSALAASRNYILPTTDPTVGQVLSASAPSGADITLSWATAAGGGFSWGATATGASGVGLSLSPTNGATGAYAFDVANSSAAPTNAWIYGVLGNTQTVAHTMAKLDTGTSALANVGVLTNLFNVNANAIGNKVDFGTTGTGYAYVVDGTGAFGGLLKYSNTVTSPSMGTDGLLRLNFNQTADLNNYSGYGLGLLSYTRTNTRTSATVTDNYSAITFARTNVQTGAGGTLLAQGSVVSIAGTDTQTAGTLTPSYDLLSLTPSLRSTGSSINITFSNSVVASGVAAIKLNSGTSAITRGIVGQWLGSAYIDINPVNGTTAATNTFYGIRYNNDSNFGTTGNSDTYFIYGYNKNSSGSGKNTFIGIYNDATTATLGTTGPSQDVALGIHQRGAGGTSIAVSSIDNVNSSTNGLVNYTLSNTQSGASVMQKIDLGTSAQGHTGLLVNMVNASTSARGITINPSTTGTGYGINFSNTGASGFTSIFQDTVISGGYLMQVNTLNGIGFYWATLNNIGLYEDTISATGKGIYQGTITASGGVGIFQSSIAGIGISQTAISSAGNGLYQGSLSGIGWNVLSMTNGNIAKFFSLNTSISTSSLIARTIDASEILSSRTSTATTGTVADNFNLSYFKRTSVQNGAGGTFTAAGSVLKLENVATQTAGTLTDTVATLSLAQSNNSVGGHILFNAYSGTPTPNNTLWYDGTSLKYRDNAGTIKTVTVT